MDINTGGHTGWAIDTWYHVAVVRVGTTVTIYRDGASVASGTDSEDFDKDVALFIGETQTPPAEGFEGYLDEIRISNMARYVGAFTPPTSAFTSDQYTKLLLHCDGADDGTTFTDSADSAPAHYVTAEGDVANTRAVRKIGDSSIKFDGTGDYLSIPDSGDWDIGTNWTVDFWAYNGASENDSYILNHSTDSSNLWGIKMKTSCAPQFFIQVSGSNIVDITATTDSGRADAWHHYAIVKSGDDWVWYVDGTSSATLTDTSDDPGFSGSLYLGRNYASATGQNFTGYLDEIRISNTARYTATFTPQTTAFTADANTMLLIHSNWAGGLGADSSGNYNTFTPTNLVATDQMIDTPTNNFCTMNPLAGGDGSGGGQVLSEGNLKDTAATDNSGIALTMGLPGSGKWYWEWEVEDYETAMFIGIYAPEKVTLDAGTTTSEGFWIYRGDTGNIYGGGSNASYGNAWNTAGDIVGVAADMDNGALYFSVNNTWQNSGVPTSGATKTGAAATDLLTTGYDWVPALKMHHTSSGVLNLNCGQDSSFAGEKTAQGNQDSNEKGDFYYEPPTDYLALCTDNLSAPEVALPGENFNTVIYDDGAGAKTGVGFQPDLVWVKSRGSTYEHELTDSVRGVTKAISSDSANAETTDSTGLTAFGTDGFTVGADTNYSDTTGTGMVGWSWKGGGTAVSNTDGTISGSVSANTTAGFSIVKWTSTGSNATIGHGLSEKPEFIIPKRLDSSSWGTGSDVVGWTKYFNLDGTDAPGTAVSWWNDTAPTASVFSIGTAWTADVDVVAYCFHSVEGYSKIGSFTGNQDADGPFIFTGFETAWVLIKKYSAGGDNWYILDNTRNLVYNPVNYSLYPDETSVEGTGGNYIDFLSNGFKIRNNYTSFNGSGTGMLYMAFAESPFKTSNAR
jgi:hypothetical protein